MKKLFTKSKALAVGAGTALLSPVKAMALTVNPGLTQEAGIGAILTIIFQVAFYIGAVGVVMGVFLTVQSFMSDNPEKRNQGITLAIVGAVLMGLETLMKTAGIVQ